MLGLFEIVQCQYLPMFVRSDERLSPGTPVSQHSMITLHPHLCVSARIRFI